MLDEETLKEIKDTYTLGDYYGAISIAMQHKVPLSLDGSVTYVPQRTCKIIDSHCSNCEMPDPTCGDAKFCAYCGAEVTK